MVPRLRLACLILGAAVLVSCTRGLIDDDENPVAPTPIVTKLTITPIGGGTMTAGGQAPITTGGVLPPSGAQLGAFADFSNIPGRYVEATWTSSDESVIGVEGAMLVARKRGTATLTATFQGHADTEQFIVDGGIAGQWSGGYLIEQCFANSAAMEDVLCRTASTGRAGIAPVGATLPLSMEITGSGPELSGVVSFGNIRGTLTGVNRGAGFFYLIGNMEGTAGAIRIAHWDTQVVRDTMEGFVGYELRLNGVTGTGGVTGKLVNMTRQ
jgi:hypothetical protein